MNGAKRAVLTIGSALVLLLAIIFLTSALGLLHQQEDSHVAGLVIIVMAWISVVSAAAAIPLTFWRSDLAVKLTLFGCVAAVPFALMTSFPALWCTIAACGNWDPPFPFEAGGLVMLGAFAIALVCQRRLIQK